MEQGEFYSDHGRAVVPYCFSVSTTSGVGAVHGVLYRGHIGLRCRVTHDTSAFMLLATSYSLSTRADSLLTTPLHSEAKHTHRPVQFAEALAPDRKLH